MLPLVDKLVKKSQTPLDNEYLEGLQTEFKTNEPYYRFLYHYVLETKPKLCMEIGVFAGLGSLHMATAAETYGGFVIGIDITTDFQWDVQINKLQNYEFINESSINAYQRVLELVLEYGYMGLIYQDSSHHFLLSNIEYKLYSKLLEKGGLWMCDDIMKEFYDPEFDPEGKTMVEYFIELPGNTKLLYKDIMHWGSVQGLIIK